VISESIGPVAYQFELPKDLGAVHDVVSNIKKCLSNEMLKPPFEEIQVDERLKYKERSVQITECQINKLRRKHIQTIKVRREGRRGSEFTWEPEADMKDIYPQLFAM
jgi:hypothetical protein